jgi:hypothetical protein
MGERQGMRGFFTAAVLVEAIKNMPQVFLQYFNYLKPAIRDSHPMPLLPLA